MAIQAMVEEATQTSKHGHHQKSQLRPLHLMDFKNEELQEIDLTEAAVLASDNSQHITSGVAAAENGGGAQG